MYSRLALAGSFVLAASLASPAHAQVAGTYKGKSSDGSDISFDVTQDSGASTFSVTGASIGLSTTCRNSTMAFGTGWGFGLSAPIVNGQATLNINTNYYSFIGAIFFSGKNMHGNVVSRTPTLNLSTTPPNSSLFCSEAKQTFTGSLEPPASVTAKPATVGAYLYDRKGRVLGVIAQH